MTSRLATLLLCTALLAAGACGVAAQSGGMSRAEVYAQVNLLAELGRRLFFDPSLSASGSSPVRRATTRPMPMGRRANAP